MKHCSRFKLNRFSASASQKITAHLSRHVGVIGPNSGAENTQKILHDYLDVEEPNGWEHQLHTEYTADLRYRRTWLIPVFSNSMDVLPTAGFTAGTSQRLLDGGFGIRVGEHIDADYGPPLIRPNLSGTHYFRPRQAPYWYFFVAVQGRYVDDNVFLDGNRDGHSHSVTKQNWVGEIQSGMVVGKVTWLLVAWLLVVKWHGCW